MNLGLKKEKTFLSFQKSSKNMHQILSSVKKTKKTNW